MDDLLMALASEGGKELVKALAAGLIDILKKVPTLWRRVGRGTEERMAAELERSAAHLSAPDEGSQVLSREQVVWETRLQDLLAEHPGARLELEQIIAQLRRENVAGPHMQQNVTAAGHGSSAQGAMFGNVINYGSPAREASGADDGDAKGQR